MKNIKSIFNYRKILAQQTNQVKYLFSSKIRCFSTTQQPGLSELYTKLKNNEDNINEKSPVEILYDYGKQVDLPSYDFLLSRILNYDWGKKAPKGPVQTTQKIVEFFSGTNDLNITLTKEQLCKLIDMYEQFREIVPPYKRFEAINIISQMEKNTAQLLQTPYIDELDSLYKKEFEFIRTKVFDIESSKALNWIINALKNSRFFDKSLLQKLCLAYIMVGSFNEVQPSAKDVYEVSNYVSALTIFNTRNDDISKVYDDYIEKLITLKLYQDKDIYKGKSCLLRYLRYQCLFPSEKNIEIFSKSLTVLLKEIQEKVEFRIEDFNQIYQFVLIYKDQLPNIGEDLIKKLKTIWKESTKETIVTKFQQDVIEVIQKLPLKYHLDNDLEGIEKDIVITRVNDDILKKPLAVEVNGVFHFSRNSEELMGRDKIKEKILAQQGFQLLIIPYSHWYILEEKQKPKYLLDVIKNSI